MKSFFVLVFYCLSLSVFAQNYRFIYEYKFVPQKEKKDSVIIDYMNLDTNGKSSLFFNDSKYKMDSAYSSSKNINQLTQYKNYDQNLSYKIFKDYTTSKINFYSKKYNLDILIEEKELPNWTLVDEFSIINTYNCQKAYTEYKGRIWYAWFTKDIPISDGPYKFTGLPGLIIRISDKELNHKFDLIQIINIKTPFIEIPKKVKIMTQSQYNELAKRNINIKTDILFTNVTNNTVTVALNNGTIMNFAKTKKTNVDNEIIERNQHATNPIELNTN